MSWWSWPGLRGAVLEQIPGRLVDIGAGGCSVETASRLGAGTFGFVEIEGADASLAEVARVCSITERPGTASPFLVRLEFLPIALPAHVNADRAPRLVAPLAAAGEKAGRSLTLVGGSERTASAPGGQVAQNRPKNADFSASGDQGHSLADDLK